MARIVMDSMGLLLCLMVLLYVSIAPIPLIGGASDFATIALGLGATWLAYRRLPKTPVVIGPFQESGEEAITSSELLRNKRRLEIFASLRQSVTRDRVLSTTLPGAAISKEPNGLMVDIKRNGVKQHGLDPTRIDRRYNNHFSPIQDTNESVINLPELRDDITGYANTGADVLQHFADLDILNRVVDLTTGIQDLTAVLQSVSEVITERFDACCTYILIPGEGKDSATVLHGFDRWKGPIQPIPVKYPFVKTAALVQGNFFQGKSMAVTHWTSPVIPVYVQKNMMGANIENAMLLPLWIRGEMKGLAFICLRSANAQFNPEDAKFAETVATHTAAAIENAYMVEKIKERAVRDERERMAREMHDTVTQTIYSASLITEALPYLWDHNPEEGKQDLKTLQHLTRGALAEMRTIIFELRPSALEVASLESLLRQLGFALSGRAHVDVQMSKDGDAALPVNVKSTVYRIAQEVFNNIAKHSEATCVKIVLKMKPGGVILTINDNGIGFKPSQVRSKGLGLQIMQERAAIIGARLEINSESERGTKIRVTWRNRPMEVEEGER